MGGLGQGDEFLMNMVGLGLMEIFPTEFGNFLRQFSSTGPARQKRKKKYKGKAKGRAHVYGFLLLEEKL